MSIDTNHLDSAGKADAPGTPGNGGSPSPVLRKRLRDLGIVLMSCTEEGELLVCASLIEDWLVRLLVESAMFRTQLRIAAQHWNSQENPEPSECAPGAGLWLAPMPVVNRRRRVGFTVAAIVTTELLAPRSEYLAALCQAASADVTLTRQLLTAISPAASSEVWRLANLVKFAHEDQAQMSGEIDALESIGRQLAESYEEINLLYTIIQNMTVQQRPERFVAHACQELLSTLSYSWVGALLAEDPRNSRFKGLAGRIIVAGQHPQGRSAAELRDVVRQLIPQIESNTPLVFDAARGQVPALLRSLGHTIIVHPITPPGKAKSGEVMGVLIAGDKQGPDTAVSNVDIKLLGATATHMAIFLENAALYDDLNAMFMGTLEALTASIDAKDRYTCGHSQRVAHLTQQLAKAVGVDDHTVGRCRIAGLVHDVGKIGVPEAVLLKPGRLTTQEFALIQKHPEIGHRILKDIPQLGDVLPGVLYHHERWDGRGYPQGLSGEAIPLVARLIGLVDAFDAMSTSRVYRSSLTRPEVLAEIVKCSGTQFDPELARVFVRLDFSEFDQLVREHKAIDLGDSSFIREEAA